MRTFVRVVACIALLTIPAHAKERPTPFRPVTGAFIALSVPNMAESVKWYSHKFGLSVVLEVPGAVQVTTLEGAGLLVELIHDPSAFPRAGTRPDLVHGPFKGGFMVRDFDGVVESLRARGAEIAFGPYPPQNGQRANVIVRDNAGNLIQVFGDSGRPPHADDDGD
jgi:catechol 2,3-dioxygenase-like lactoylglutathione lyase family enzyme